MFIFIMKQIIEITGKQEPFLMRQVVIKPRSAEEAFNIIKKAVANEKTVQMIVTPRIDRGRKAYFYVGIRIDRQEVDFKFPVNRETRQYLLSYMNGETPLPEISNYEPETVTSADEAGWFDTLEDQLLDMKLVGKEKLEITDGANYLKVSYKMKNGKITFDKGVVEDIFALIGIA